MVICKQRKGRHVKLLLLVCAGGAVGSGVRYGVDVALLHYLKGPATSFPCATLVVNLAGCFLAGLLYGWLSRGSVPFGPELKVLLITGLCGGLTTFSAFALQSVEIAPGKAIANVLASVIGGLALAWTGAWVTAASTT
jgi:CrcB protein